MAKEKWPLTAKGYIRVIIMMILAIVFLTAISILLITYGINNDKRFFLVVGIIGLAIDIFYLIIGILNIKNFYRGE